MERTRFLICPEEKSRMASSGDVCPKVGFEHSKLNPTQATANQVGLRNKGFPGKRSTFDLAPAVLKQSSIASCAITTCFTITQGQAIRSILGRSRVTHFILWAESQYRKPRVSPPWSRALARSNPTTTRSWAV